MSCEGTKCTATLIRYENPDFSHPFDNPASTFICTRLSDGKQTFSQAVYDPAEAEFKKIVAGMNKTSPVKDSCAQGCQCRIEYEKRGRARRVSLPALQVDITITVTGGQPTVASYRVVTTVEKVTYTGIGECVSTAAGGGKSKG